MPYTMFDELKITFDEDTAKEVYTYTASQHPNQDCETVILANMDFVKRNFDSSKHHDFLEYLYEAIKNDYAAASKESVEQKKPVLDVLTELFYDKERAEKIYRQIQTKYEGVDYDELIKANINFARKKEKKLGVGFLPYLQDAIEKNMAGYGNG